MKTNCNSADEFNALQSVKNQLENQLKWYKKESPFDTEYYQSGEGFKENKNCMRKLSQEECEDLLLRISGGMKLLKEYENEIYINGLELFKCRTLLNKAISEE